MEHKGLVARVSEQLERLIALGHMPKDTLPSERVMAKRYGVSRTTIRGALQGLAARGLIVQHPGRQSRTVGLGEALSLESLKLLLPEGRTDLDRRYLLEGYFSLKREVTVELLAACCEHASPQDVELLKSASFVLRDDARWQEEPRRWAQREFELLRLAARAADRPGHMLLIVTLEKAFWGVAESVLPALQAEAVREWAMFVFDALVDRDAQLVRRELPALLKAVDGPMLDRLAPVSDAHMEPASPATPVEVPLSGETAADWYAGHTSSQPARPTGGLPIQDVEPASVSPMPSRSAPADSSVSPSAGGFQGTFGSLERSAHPPGLLSASTVLLERNGAPPTLFLALAARSSERAEAHPGSGSGDSQEPTGERCVLGLHPEGEPSPDRGAGEHHSGKSHS
ncbi:FadR/GntR family transcriptional regulator [Hyalangium versicolor]|uniref:FadR/GntR family transcriptional regulator n=1 Tax=Hyalangium versicolor TaxID=2861190 RepID=UPI001CCAC12F|nr:GntR family transcriptional regulator [Hyalangium versicolor]